VISPLEPDIKPDDNGVYKSKSARRQHKSDGIYMIRIENIGDSYFDTEQEIADYIKGLFSCVGVQADKIHIYRKMDMIFTGKVDLIPV